MAAVDLKALVGKLNGVCRTSLESAAGLTLSRSHYNIEIEHWLLKLLESSNSDLQLILRHYEVDESRLIADREQPSARPFTSGGQACAGILGAGFAAIRCAEGAVLPSARRSAVG